jgi:hypothetical protein
MNNNNLTRALNQVQGEFDEKVIQRRSAAMDVFQGLLEESPHWPILRKKLLGFFGESGVQGDLRNIVEQVRREHSQPKQIEISNQIVEVGDV